MKQLTAFMLCVFIALMAQAQKAKQFELTSPDGKIKTTISAGEKLTYSVSYDGTEILAPSALAMTLSNGTTVGENTKVTGSKRVSVDEMVPSPFYRATELADKYNQLTLNLGKNWSVIFRAYNDGVAYRFVTTEKKPFNVMNETVDYQFTTDGVATVPYVRNNQPTFEGQFFNSFENEYTVAKLSDLNKKRLIFLPLSVRPNDNVNVCITESALENYPGMYLNSGVGTNCLTGVFAPRPKTVQQGGHNKLQMLVTEREDYIAKVDGPRNFPWRIAIITTEDKDLAASNLSYLLAEPSRVDDISWIKPGKVAWDWWNNWNLDGVDFKTGVNNDTYKAYIDFASKKGIEYVILDEGWAVNLQADLMQVIDQINLPELVAYAKERNVDLILWAGFHAFDRDMENVCKHYSDMGIKGFKVDFMDRDDQMMTDFNYRAAETCAKHHLILDLHGTHKPAGLNRTYPNVLNFEGVNGLEQMKWSSIDLDQMKYDVTIPFLRQVSGPMDYTQGAMLNGTKSNYRASNSEPMSQGTRCHQLAMYLVFDSPFNMLCDTPSNYMREEECTDFIAGVPTVWDETVVLDGKMGEYIVTARRKGDTWYVGGMTNWTPRDITVDLSFLNPGNHTATIFKDGVNAHRIARDYKRTEEKVSNNSKLNIHLAPGGGFAAQIK